MDKGALSGVRIADFSIAWAGPYATTLLSFMGAEVIKIESNSKLDHTRRLSMTTGGVFDQLDHSPVFNDINLNKLGVTLNLKQPRGIELAKKIVSISDIVIQNMRPGVIERLGLGYDVLRDVKPDIIYLSSSMRGNDGPERTYGGYAPNFAAVGGLSYLTGYADSYPANLMGEVDLMAATTSAFGILAALNHRLQTGEGQYIDVSSSDSVSVHMGEVLLDYDMNGRVQTRKGNDDEYMAPHNCYRCKGEDDWVSIAVATDSEWQSFCNALGNPVWTSDDRFSHASGRLQNREELDRLVEQWTIECTNYEVMDRLQKAGVAAVPSFDSEDLCTDPHLQERGYWVESHHPIIGKQIVAAPPWKLSATPAGVYGHGPLLGEHNQYVFGELLGISSEEIAQLIEAQVIY